MRQEIFEDTNGARYIGQLNFTNDVPGDGYIIKKAAPWKGARNLSHQGDVDIDQMPIPDDWETFSLPEIRTKMREVWLPRNRHELLAKFADHCTFCKQYGCSLV